MTHPSRELAYQIHDLRRRARMAVLSSIAQLVGGNGKVNENGERERFRARHLL